MNLLETTEFRISVTGDKTGESYVGTFSVLRRLSHRMEMARDQIYRDLLGANPQFASERAKEQAEIFADLKVSVIKAPTWWTESGGGQDLCDDNVLQEIWSESIKTRVNAIKEVQERAKEAGAALKEAAK